MSDDLVPPSDAEIADGHRAWMAERAERVIQLRRDARAVFSAMEGWQRVRTEDEWARTYEEAQEGYVAGRFLLERLGAERHLDPELMAVLMQLRKGLLGPDGGSVQEAMLADLVVLSYSNSLRLQQWIGNLAVAIEHEFFGAESPSVQFQGRYGRQVRFKVEDHLVRLGEQLLPLQDRTNRMMLRNLKALADMRRAPAPSVAINQAGQVNVGAQQVNVARDATPHVDAASVDTTAQCRPPSSKH
jgi:hypothetical protein